MSDSWIQTYTGKKFDIDNLDPSMVCLEDIAHALSMLCRYNGHCEMFYSVAEHSVIMSQYVPKHLALDALLHDAAEAYITDVPRPFKKLLIGFSGLESKIMTVIYEHFGLKEPEYDQYPIIKNGDLQMLAIEQQQLLKPSPEPWECIEGLDRWTPIPILPIWHPTLAKEQFMETFKKLYAERMFKTTKWEEAQDAELVEQNEGTDVCGEGGCVDCECTPDCSDKSRSELPLCNSEDCAA